MKDRNDKSEEALPILKRGFLEKFINDLKSLAIGVCIGAVLGLIASYFLGISAQSGLKIGALTGAIVALLKGAIAPKINFDQRPPDKGPDS
ncbi:hypothetical protein SuNHUV7_02220 (plasmid) [Pseudoseohaeicola sp. NH-UV-7]